MRIIAIISFILYACLSYGQYGNEWIDYGSSYYRIPIAQTGVYQLHHDSLTNAGVPISGVNSSEIKLYAKERELVIYVNDGGDGIFDNADYIQFYGTKNDGWLDSSLYINPSDIGNPSYSLVNDTLYHYLTWNSGIGKRINDYSDTNFGSYTPINYFLKQNYVSYDNQYQYGPLLLGNSSTRYMPAEGWSETKRNSFSGTNYTNFSIATPNVYSGPGAPNATIHAIAMGASDAADTVGLGNHHLQYQINNGGTYTTLFDTLYKGYQLIKKNLSVLASDLTNGTTIIRHQYVPDLAVASDYQASSYSSILYPHTPDLAGASYYEFTLPHNPSETHNYLSLSNVGASNPHIWAFGGTSGHHIIPTAAINYDALIPNASNSADRFTILFDESDIIHLSSNEITAINGSGLMVDVTNVSSDSAYIIITSDELWGAAQNYQNYRISTGYDVELVNINDLVDQFGGGVKHHPLSIRRYLEYAYQNFSTPPGNVLIIGKGIREASDADHGTRKSSTNFNLCHVPTFGYPASDVYFTTSLDSNSYYIQNIPIGRIAAHDSAEVEHYLSKVIEYEAAQNDPIYTLANKEWMKKVMHFSGGAGTAEQQLFQSYLNNYADIIEDTLFGGYTYLYAKTSSQPIDIVEFHEIQDNLEHGTSIMTFFGHATATGFDQNIDAPSNWNNQGRYPILIGNSCYTGDIHHPLSQSTSEEFVMEENAGTIGFIASTKLGFSGHLNTFTSSLYKEIGMHNYGGTIGKSIIGGGLGAYNVFGPTNDYAEMTIGQINLHGDPALRINPHENPELVIEPTSTFFTPSNIDLSVDSLTLNIVLTNIGRATNETFNIDVIRHFADGTDTTYVITRNGSYYKDTVRLTMPLLPLKSVGQNSFEVLVDQPSVIPEAYDEINNNILTKDLYLLFDGILPIFPYNYAIVPLDSQVLKASTINPLAAEKTYIFEIDTIDFEGAPSPFKKMQLITSEGGVVEAFPSGWINATTGLADNLVLSDSTVYFWRVSLDSSTKVWTERSFQYIPGKTGWGQSHFFQYKKDDFLSIEYDRPNRQLNFEQRFRVLFNSVYGNANNFFEYANTLYTLDGSVDDGEDNLCSVTPTIYLAVIDPYELKAWENDGGIGTNHNYGDHKDLSNGGCRPWRTEGYFIFRQNNGTHLANLDTMLNNHIPQGHYVLAYTVRAKYSQWNTYYPDLFNVFQSFGATNVAPANSEVPFIFFWQQGVSGSFQEVYGSHLNDTITFTDSLWSPNYIGNVYSEIAGPAYNWNSLHWEQEGLEIGNDSVRLKLHGIDLQGNKTQVMDTLFTASDSIVNLGAIVNANQHPYLQLQAYIHDSLSFTPAQLKRWQLIYDPVPELAINPKKGYYFSLESDTIQEGQDVSLAVAIENVSPWDMDSLKVNYYLEDQYYNQTFANYPRQAPLLAGQHIIDTITFNTENYPGKNSFWVIGNPYINTYQQDQLEQYYVNNLMRVTFETDEDRINPILDVTFDGLHILDGDIVSAKPMISISLDDENPFLLMNEDADTSNFVVWLTDPLGNTRRIPFVDGNGIEVMRWIPTNSSDNVFKIEYDADFLIDGTYNLRIEASDISGNQSGAIDYEINFEIINASSITEVLNYPNPFSTRTQFVFTLTGSELPDDMLIQIMTVTGKVVKEITMAELGPINIGRNRTSYWWDGTDNFGDPLANGVYLYKVFTRLNNEEIERYSTNADKYFKKGIGKMYLMR